MAINLSIKNVPDTLADRLRRRAERNHRSLQGELMAILEKALASSERASPAEVLDRVRKLGVRTDDESAAMIRADRDAR
ncbi:MAG TPA: Arc family DNA-binding protein [Thermoanaerobaculia bacterium]|jgi:plasmid stability protein